MSIIIQAKADTWKDPSWKEMLDSSDVIALIKYTSHGKFSARAIIQKIYKGQLQVGDQIWISGFSNRYGPIDKVRRGNTYIVFLNLPGHNETTRSATTVRGVRRHILSKKFIDAYDNNQAYYVWSPTSGDLKVKDRKVQYDLILTSYSKEQNYYSLQEFESFLKTYLTNNRLYSLQLSNDLILKLKPVSENSLNTQYLMQLFLLGYNQYDSAFQNYTKVTYTSSKYALAQLLGNIQTEKSRDVLIELLNDTNSLVQSEAVKQLRNEPAEIIGPVLLQHLKTTSITNFGPANSIILAIDRLGEGKIEIIKMLGTLQYKPAIPELLSLLNTEDEKLFVVVIEDLRCIGTKDYINYINKHLDTKTDRLIEVISNMIANYNLFECLPSFRNFISTCNRNMHINYEYTISSYHGIGNFKDKATISFLLSDFERYLTYKDTLKKYNQERWTQSYIETFANLRLEGARPLIYKAIYDWTGLNADFGKYPWLFSIKKKLEDSLRTIFTNKLVAQGYKLNHCIVFIENTREVSTGSKPIANYLIEVIIPARNNGRKHQQIIMTALRLPQQSLSIRYRNGVYFTKKQDRVEERFWESSIHYFLDYAEAIPSQTDIDFLQAILDFNFTDDKFYRKRISETIKKIKVQLGQ